MSKRCSKRLNGPVILALNRCPFVPRKNKGFDLFFLEKGPERRLKCTGVNMVCVSTVALTQRSVLVCACVCVRVCACDKNENIEVFQ